MKRFFVFTLTLKEGGGTVPCGAPFLEDSGIVAANDSQNINESFSFNLRNKDEGNAHISATSALDVRHIPTNVRRPWCPARAIYHFDL